MGIECPTSNNRSITKSKTLLVLSVVPGKQPYLPCMVTSTSGKAGRQEEIHEKLRAHYTPRHYEPSHGQQTAVFPTIRHSQGEVWYWCLDVSKECCSKAICMKCSILNVESTAKPEALLALALDLGKWANSPGMASSILDQSGGPKRLHERVGVHYTPKKIDEQYTSCSPVGIERDLMVIHQVETHDKCHMS
jgi:hypothetical protein